eukprot:4263964-Prorocentrum_lima.AAC.1
MSARRRRCGCQRVRRHRSQRRCTAVCPTTNSIPQNRPHQASNPFNLTLVHAGRGRQATKMRRRVVSNLAPSLESL